MLTGQLIWSVTTLWCSRSKMMMIVSELFVFWTHFILSCSVASSFELYPVCIQYDENKVIFLAPLCFCLLACLKLPDVPHTQVSEETKKAEYQEGDVIHFTCETGYKSDQTSKYVCTRNGWLTVRQGTCYCELNDFLF